MRISKILGLAALVLSVQACTNNGIVGEKAKDYELVIAHVNDVHGRAMEGKNDGMGYSRVATLVENLKKDSANKNVIFLDAGDSLHGTNFATLERGDSIAKILDKMDLVAMAPGNHDFNYGQERLREIDNNTKFQVLAANVFNQEGKYLTKPHMIKEIEGVKVGILGLATPETLYKTNPNNVKGLIFENPVAATERAVGELKAMGAQYIIVLSHLGDDESTEPGLRSDAVAHVKGVDLIIDGHSHTLLKEKKMVNGVPVVQTGEYNKNLGVIKIDFDDLKKGLDPVTYELILKETALGKKGEDGKVVGGVEENKEIKEFIEGIKDKQKAITEVVIGKTGVKLEGDRDLVRTGETNLSNLITDAMVWKSGADMSLTNGGGIRASINAGDITVGDVVTVLPFGNYVVTKELTGADIKAALEHGFKDTPKSAGSQAQVGGITLNLDTTKPAGERVSNIRFKNGKKFTLTGKYVVATNDFMAVGGDSYAMFKGKKEIANYPGLDEVVIEYIREKGITAQKADGRVKTKK
ncbi:MAG: bifunctional metallophosphatase/5'-nucleotidase [Fusobacteriaceae bacterium]